MNDKDKKKFGEMMGIMAVTFDKALSKSLLEVYFNILKNYEVDQVKIAIEKAMEQFKWFPKPAELIELIGGGPGRVEDIAQIQADLVINAIRKVGSYQSIRFKDSVVTAVIQQSFGGWTKICLELMETNEKWFRKDFIAAYQTYFRQGIKGNGHLAGLIETDNMTRGHLEFIPDPVMVEGVEILRIELKN